MRIVRATVRAVLVASLAATATVGASVSASAAYQCREIDDIYYCFDDAAPGDGAIVGWNGGVSGDVVIPATIEYNAITYDVVAIDDEAFRYGPTLTSITIPDSVVSIGSRAFYKHSTLTSVTFGSGLTSIGEEAFTEAGLTSLSLPASLVSIGNDAFRANAIATLDLGTGVEIIGAYAFRNNQIASLTIPASVTGIGPHAFRDNLLTSLDLGTGTYSLGNWAFANNMLTTLTIPDGMLAIPNSAFRVNDIVTLDLGSGVQSIGANAFMANDPAELIIPSSVTSIGGDAFLRTGSDTTLGDTVTFLGDAPSTGPAPFGPGGTDGVTVYYYERNAASGFTAPTWSTGDEDYTSVSLVTITIEPANGELQFTFDIPLSSIPTMPTLLRSGFDFAGWDLDTDTAVLSDVLFTALWTETPEPVVEEETLPETGFDSAGAVTAIALLATGAALVIARRRVSI